MPLVKPDQAYRGKNLTQRFATHVSYSHVTRICFILVYGGAGVKRGQPKSPQNCELSPKKTVVGDTPLAVGCVRAYTYGTEPQFSTA
jgi:hypothetical protein